MTFEPVTIWTTIRYWLIIKPYKWLHRNDVRRSSPILKEIFKGETK